MCGFRHCDIFTVFSCESSACFISGRVPPAFSFIFFGLFDNDAEIETIDCTATNTKYDKFRFGDYFNMRLTNVFVEGKGLVPELLEQ